jgi:hypothetical protein
MIHAVVALMLGTVGVQQESEKPALQCEVGPLHKTFGGNPWLVYGCSDGATLVVVSSGDSPANPFVFVVFPKDGSYEMSGEGTGAKEATAAAFEDLKRLTTDAITALLAEAKATQRQ